MAGCVTKGGHARDARHHACPVTHKVEAISKWRDLCLHGLVTSAHPVIILNLPCHVSGVGIGQVAVCVGHTADMVAVHVRDYDDGDVIRDQSGLPECGRHALSAQTGIKENDVFSGADHGRRKEETSAIGGNECLATGCLKRLGVDIHAENALDVLVHDARSGKERRDLKVSKREGVLQRVHWPFGRSMSNCSGCRSRRDWS